MEFKDLLTYMVQKDASDLYLTTGAAASVKINGQMAKINDQALAPGFVHSLAHDVMNQEQAAEFKDSPEMNLAISARGLGRFRVNIFQQRGETAMVIRHIQVNIPSLQELGIPDIIKTLTMQKRGLLLFVGATGTGKSTSMASLINYRNENSADHIVTIEDPIEFVHNHKKSIVNQREVGVDTDSYEIALKNTLRQAPDVILIGEIRSQDTMQHAIAFAETGHLCISTLHANNANQALDRIINFFPENRRGQLLLDLSLNLRGIISQRLIPTPNKERVAAFEILINTPLMSDLIKRGDIDALKEVMKKSENLGMQTFDAALYNLYMDGQITLEEALRNADSENNLRLRINLKEGVDEESQLDLTIENDKEQGTLRPEAMVRNIANGNGGGKAGGGGEELDWLKDE